MQTGIIQKVQSKYVCHRPTAEYDSVTFVVNHEVAASDHIQVKPDIPDRWRSTAESIRYFSWVVEQIQALQQELGIPSEKQ